MTCAVLYCWPLSANWGLARVSLPLLLKQLCHKTALHLVLLRVLRLLCALWHFSFMLFYCQEMAHKLFKRRPCNTEWIQVLKKANLDCGKAGFGTSSAFDLVVISTIASVVLDCPAYWWYSTALWSLPYKIPAGYWRFRAGLLIWIHSRFTLQCIETVIWPILIWTQTTLKLQIMPGGLANNLVVWTFLTCLEACPPSWSLQTPLTPQGSSASAPALVGCFSPHVRECVSFALCVPSCFDSCKHTFCVLFSLFCCRLLSHV